MNKIASPQDTRTELRALVDYCASPKPSRTTLAERLRKLANHIQPESRVAASPADVRKEFKEAIEAYWRNLHKDERVEHARRIMYMLSQYRWLQDQIPNDVLGLARRDAR